MSAEGVFQFEQSGYRTQVRLGVNLDTLIEEWGVLRSHMIRHLPEIFSRDEWAFLLQFIAPDRLQTPWKECFGSRVQDGARPDQIAVPARRVALWLPNNVSLLGCLAVVLLSLTNAEVRIKCGSSGQDLVTPWIAFAREHLPEGQLSCWFSEKIELHTFGRDDTRNRCMSEWADARIFFGGDEGARAVAALPSRIGAPFFAFGNKVSEAWVTPAAAAQANTAETMAKIFAIYGQAGCTSPKRAVVVGGSRGDALALADGMRRAWVTAVRQRPAQAQASQVVMAAQWARAEGFEVHTLADNAAVLVLSPAEPVRIFAHLALQIQWGRLPEVVASSAPNLQTIGIGCSETQSPSDWLDAVASAGANRLVPLARMHDFSHVWDGLAWWRGLFRLIEL